MAHWGYAAPSDTSPPFDAPRIAVPYKTIRSKADLALKGAPSAFGNL
jgi:hypothetical protein